MFLEDSLEQALTNKDTPKARRRVNHDNSCLSSFYNGVRNMWLSYLRWALGFTIFGFINNTKQRANRLVSWIWSQPLPSIVRMVQGQFDEVVPINLDDNSKWMPSAGAYVSIPLALAVTPSKMSAAASTADPSGPANTIDAQPTIGDMRRFDCVFGCQRKVSRNHIIHSITHEVRHCCDDCIPKIHVLSYRWSDVPRQLETKECSCGHACASNGGHLTILPKVPAWIWVDHIARSEDSMDAITTARKIYRQAEKRWYYYSSDILQAIYIPFRVLCFFRLFLILPAWALNLVLHFIRVFIRFSTRLVIMLHSKINERVYRKIEEIPFFGTLVYLIIVALFLFIFFACVELCRAFDAFLYALIRLNSFVTTYLLGWTDAFSPPSLARHRTRFWLAAENLYRPFAAATTSSGPFFAPWLMHIPCSHIRFLMTPRINEAEAVHTWIKYAIRNMDMTCPHDISLLVQAFGTRQIVEAGKHNFANVEGPQWMASYDLDGMCARVKAKPRPMDPSFFLSLGNVLNSSNLGEKLFILHDNEGIMKFVVIAVPSHAMFAFILPAFEYKTIVIPVDSVNLQQFPGAHDRRIMHMRPLDKLELVSCVAASTNNPRVHASDYVSNILIGDFESN
jgi:hypothetical protein